jgi:hypothetical protein
LMICPTYFNPLVVFMWFVITRNQQEQQTRYLGSIYHYYLTNRDSSVGMRSLDIFNWTNPFSRIMALGSTQPLTEMSTRNLPGGKGRPARKADNLTAICEPII